MIKEGLSLTELKKILKKWQTNLLLKDWVLSIKIVEFRRKDFRQSGDIKVDLKNKKAIILLTNKPFKNEEKVIVHELSHLLLWEFDHFCEKIALKTNKPFEGDHDKYMGKLEETVSELTKILISKYKK
ncbi:MAG TPA: hypothetical protein VJB67_02520 [Patescibacteria group bacterium]|nr:hypothetical protein [Patescibacteria group bacterium]